MTGGVSRCRHCDLRGHKCPRRRPSCNLKRLRVRVDVCRCLRRHLFTLNGAATNHPISTPVRAAPPQPSPPPWRRGSFAHAEQPAILSRQRPSHRCKAVAPPASSVSIPIITSTLALGLLILLTNSSSATTTKRRGGAPSALATTAAAAVLLLAALQLGQPSGALGAVFFAAGALLAWAGGRSESSSDGAATPGSARRASLRSAAMTTALCALALALLAPALIALLLGEGECRRTKGDDRRGEQGGG